MDCTDIPTTGSPVASILAWAIALLLLGLALVLVRSRRTGTITVLVLLLLTGGVAAFGLASGSPAFADSADCVPLDNDLTITQVSTLTGLAPGVPPAPITGVIVNRGAESPIITAVTVSIASVTKAPDAVTGPCGPSDYILSNVRMPIGRALPSGGSAQFSGASIQFNDKSTNQDACQGARIKLTYVSS